MNVAEFLAELPKRSALVVGEICLDRWCTYDPAASEPSRETGIPRIAVVETDVTPGAGGTIANNLASIGVGRVNVLGVAGDDGSGYELRTALECRGISSELLLRLRGRPTFTYTKLINQATRIEDQPRIDFIANQFLTPEIEQAILERLRQHAHSFDIIFVSDQAETGQAGVITPAVREALTAIARERIVWVDSRLRAHEFRNVILKPNEREADAASQRLFGKRDYGALREATESPCLIVTLAERGALVIDEHGQRLVSAFPNLQPVDICGAGDSFSAAAGMAYALGASPDLAARFGNFAASITVTKPGTGTALPEEMLAAEARWAS
jgi:rfaE bifunctional protein kinase chain/domain